jgi:hypothetical protein
MTRATACGHWGQPIRVWAADDDVAELRRAAARETIRTGRPVSMADVVRAAIRAAIREARLGTAPAERN